MSRRVTFIFLLALYGVSFGQIDPAAKPFLSGAVPVEPRVPVRTLDYTLCATSYEEADRTETCVRTAADFVRRRMLIETQDGGEAITEMVYADGRVRMRNPVSGRPTGLPEDQAAIIKRSFSYLAEMVRTGGALPDEILRATYDGAQRYGGVVHGEQVTAEVMAASLMTGHITPRKTTMRFVFDSDKKLLAYVVETPPRRLLHVLANPAEPVPIRRMLSGSVY